MITPYSKHIWADLAALALGSVLINNMLKQRSPCKCKYSTDSICKTTIGLFIKPVLMHATLVY